MKDEVLVALLLTLVSLTYFLFLGLRAIPRTKTRKGFFKAGKSISSTELSNTIAAAGLSNAAVAIAYLQLTPSFGIFLLIALAANLLTQVAMIYLIRHAKVDIGKITTVGNMVYEFTGSENISRWVEVITYVGFFAALLVEVIIGSSLFSFVLTGVPYADFLGVIVVTAIVLGYIVTGGLTATIESDSWQLRLIFLGGFALAATSLALLSNQSSYAAVSTEFSIYGAAPGSLLLWWALITVVLSVLAPIGQVSAWQRLSATRPDQRIKGVVRSIFLLAVLYSIFFTAGLAFAYKGVAVQDWGAVFLVMENLGGVFFQVLFPLLFVGLVAAMISTADTNTLAIIYSLRAKDNRSEEDLGVGRKKIIKMSIVIFGIVIASFFVFKETAESNTLLSIIFLFFGLHVLLAPLVISIVLGRNILRSESALLYGLIVGLSFLLIFGVVAMRTNELVYTFIGDFFGFLIVCIGTYFAFQNRGHENGRSA